MGWAFGHTKLCKLRSSNVLQGFNISFISELTFPLNLGHIKTFYQLFFLYVHFKCAEMIFSFET